MGVVIYIYKKGYRVFLKECEWELGCKCVLFYTKSEQDVERGSGCVWLFEGVDFKESSVLLR